jgi:hypothetical protein
MSFRGRATEVLERTVTPAVVGILVATRISVGRAGTQPGRNVDRYRRRRNGGSLPSQSNLVILRAGIFRFEAGFLP